MARSNMQPRAPRFPVWEAMPYDRTADMMYYIAAGELRSVGFDGTGFTSFATTLETPVPAWEAMSLVFVPDAPDGPTPIPLPAGMLLMSTALIGLGVLRKGSSPWSRRCRAIPRI